MENTVKLCFFSFGIMEQGGGFENYVIETAVGLKQYYPATDITILTASPRLTERLQSLLTLYHWRKHDVASIYRESRQAVESKLGGRVQYRHFDRITDLRRMLQDYDVIYTKNEILELGLIKRIGYAKLPPVIIGVHTSIYYPVAPSASARLHNLLYTGRLYQWLINGAQSIKVNTRDDQEFVQCKLKFPVVQVVHHAFVVTDRPGPQRHDGLNLLFVGRLSEQKGVDILLAVTDMLAQNGVLARLRLKIAGSGDAAITQKVLELADRYENVTYLGHVANAEIGGLYDWCDVTVIPSRYETLNKVAIETGMACRIALASDIPG
ncbi:MAG TPA: glycosyltransferase family 4 protein, partial [Candidatus Saccharimonadia bacterium]